MSEFELRCTVALCTMSSLVCQVCDCTVLFPGWRALAHTSCACTREPTTTAIGVTTSHACKETFMAGPSSRS